MKRYPCSTVPKGPQSIRRTKIDHEVRASAAIDVSRGDVDGTESVHLNPCAVISVHPEPKGCTEVDDKIVLPIAVDISGQQRVSVKSMEPNPPGVIGEDVEPEAWKVSNQLVSELPVQ